MSRRLASSCANLGTAMPCNFAVAADESSVCYWGMDCAGEAQTPRPTVATEHVVVEAEHPKGVGVEHLDAAVEAPVH